MKKFLSIFGISSILVLGACSNEESSDTSSEESSEESTEQSENTQQGNLIDSNNIVEEQWIDFEGQEASSDSYVTTNEIEYDPSNTYTLSGGAYISYYTDGNFIETVQQGEPGAIKTVDEADAIVISLHESFIDNLTLEVE